MRRLLSRLVRVTPIAVGAAVGILAVGVLAIIGGSYDHKVVHDQLAPQKIFFPPAKSPELFPDLRQYAGQQLVTGEQAKAYADKFIARHLQKIAGGQTYAQVSEKYLANPKDAMLAQQRATLFQGETLRGLLLNAWGWGMIGSIAIAVGIILVVLGAVLLVIPLGNWVLNERGSPAVA